MPGLQTVLIEGAFDYSDRAAINSNFTNTPGIVASSVNSAFPYTSFGTAITLLAAGAAATGTFRVNITGVVTTTITTATSWLFTIGYTDDQGARTPTVATSSTMTAGTVEQGSYLFRNTGAAAITVTPTSASAAAGVIAYSVVLERLA